MGHFSAEHDRPQRPGRAWRGAHAGRPPQARRTPLGARAGRIRRRDPERAARSSGAPCARSDRPSTSSDAGRRRTPRTRSSCWRTTTRRRPASCSTRRRSAPFHERFPDGDPEHQDPAAAVVGRLRRADRWASLAAVTGRRGPGEGGARPEPRGSQRRGARRHVALETSPAPTTTSPPGRPCRAGGDAARAPASRACGSGSSRPAPRRRSRTGSAASWTATPRRARPDATSFLCISTRSGSPRLMHARGRGPGWMEDYDPELSRYASPAWPSATASASSAASAPGRRPTRSFPQRHGYPIANLSSVNDYHYLTQLPPALRRPRT